MLKTVNKHVHLTFTLFLELWMKKGKVESKKENAKMTHLVLIHPQWSNYELLKCAVAIYALAFYYFNLK